MNENFRLKVQIAKVTSECPYLALDTPSHSRVQAQMNSLTPLRVPRQLLVKKSRSAKSSRSEEGEEGEEGGGAGSGGRTGNQTDQEKTIVKKTASLIEVRANTLLNGCSIDFKGRNFRLVRNF